MTLCHLPSVRRNTLPLVVNLFFGIFLPPFLTTNTTGYVGPMSTPSFQIGRRKISPPFGGFTPTLGREFYEVLFFVYAPQILRWESPLWAEEKRSFFPAKNSLCRGLGVPGSPRRVRTAYSRTLCLPCRKQKNSTTPIVTPWRTALLWENPAPTTHSLTPRLFYRPTLFRPVGTSEKARSDRLCRAL